MIFFPENTEIRVKLWSATTDIVGVLYNNIPLQINSYSK